MKAIDKVNKFFNREYLIVIGKCKTTKKMVSMHAVMHKRGFQWCLILPNEQKVNFLFQAEPKNEFLNMVDKRTIKLLDKIPYPWDSK